MILDLIAAVERLESAIRESREADTQRDSISPENVAAYVKASGISEGACVALRVAAERLCVLLRAEGL